jgi:2-polyprenyl-3-methyl-5-hydroxy-6-metoxy-1,4-benzoquinol methylase
MKNKPHHWTEELFDRHPELFVDAFEERSDRTPNEINTLLQHLHEQGYTPGRILDLNCGIGRHSIDLARRNIKVVGTDISSHYIALARERAREAGIGDNTEFKRVDMRKISRALSVEKPFDGIICLWTSFGFYDDKTNRKILRSCLNLVCPGGFFALDIINRDWLLQHYEAHRFSKSGDRLVLQESTFNPENSRNYSTWTFLKPTGEKSYTEEKSIQVDHRIWSLHELIHLFEGTGWKFKAAYPGISAVGFAPQNEPSGSQETDITKSALMLLISYRP